MYSTLCIGYIIDECIGLSSHWYREHMVSTNGFECVCYGRPRCILGFALARKRWGKDKIGGEILAKSRIFARSHRCHCNKLARVRCLPLHAVWTIQIILTRILPIQKDAIGLNNGKLETWLESAPDRKTYAYLNPKYVLCPIIQYISFALKGQCHKIENCYPCLLWFLPTLLLC